MRSPTKQRQKYVPRRGNVDGGKRLTQGERNTCRLPCCRWPSGRIAPIGNVHPPRGRRWDACRSTPVPIGRWTWFGRPNFHPVSVQHHEPCAFQVGQAPNAERVVATQVVGGEHVGDVAIAHAPWLRSQNPHVSTKLSGSYHDTEVASASNPSNTQWFPPGSRSQERHAGVGLFRMDTPLYNTSATGMPSFSAGNSIASKGQSAVSVATGCRTGMV